MLPGAADGAGGPGAKAAGHDARLLIQEGPVQAFILPLKFLRFRGEGEVSLLLFGQERLLTAQIPELPQELSESGLSPFQLLPAGGERRDLRACSFQSRSLLLKLRQLPGKAVRGLFQSGLLLPEDGQRLLLPAQVPGDPF